ncbi:MAG: hypothetical protein KF729_12390 [Sandaracinaceae bacterium]|nr:hypothetical protein [Sandaracinaceae bacterium]
MSEAFLDALGFRESWPHKGQRPSGDWIRLIPRYIAHPLVVEGRPCETDGGFIHLDHVFDLKLFGFGDYWGRGPNLLVSHAFRRVWEEAAYQGLEFAEPQRATPYLPRVDTPWLCRPSRYAPLVSDRVTISPLARPRGRDYGYHGRPSEPLEICVPPLPDDTAVGGPWFDTGSLPFQPLIVPATFLERFEERTGRRPDLAWAPCRLIQSPEHELRAREEAFGPLRPVPPEPTRYRDLDEALAEARLEAGARKHRLLGVTEAPKDLAPHAWSLVERVAGSVFFGGALGFFPASQRDLDRFEPGSIVVYNVAQYLPLDQVNEESFREFYLELGYPLEPQWTVIGWLANDFPSLIALTERGGVVRAEACGELNLRYESFSDFFADTMADLRWAHEHGLYAAAWHGWW